MIRDFNIPGYVNFPPMAWRNIQSIDVGKTLVYIVTFNSDLSDDEYTNQNLPHLGFFCGDDVTPRNNSPLSRNLIESIDDLRNHRIETNNIYFKDGKSIPLSSCILVGWSRFTYEFSDRVDPWFCTFRDLTEEGRKLYYSMKKLHYNSEVRILTFSRINNE